jgi:methylamine dehydrogenase heavy chain
MNALPPSLSRLAGPIGAALLGLGLVTALPAYAAGSGAAKKAAPAASAAAAKVVPAELPPETLTVSTIDTARSARVYVADVAISHISDGRVRIFDAKDGKFLGMVSTAFAGNYALSAKHDQMYVATTHLSRSTRGDRTDVLEVYDTTSLVHQFEVILPTKRAQSLPYRYLVRPTGNGRFVLVMNATPATSVTVVDLQTRKVAAEVPTPGCWGTFAAATHASRFSMLCGDGTVATITLDDNGQPVDRQVSAPLFDADKDAWFHHAEQVGDRFWFVSFKGVLHELNLGGAKAELKSSRNLVNAADAKAGWRPGGYQPFAVDPQGRWAVVGMHPKGAEGSHKSPAAKLWVVDLASGKRTAVLPGVMALSLNFSGNGQRLHALDADKGAFHSWAWDAGKIKKLVYLPGAGEAASQIESHD